MFAGRHQHNLSRFARPTALPHVMLTFVRICDDVIRVEGLDQIQKALASISTMLHPQPSRRNGCRKHNRNRSPRLMVHLLSKMPTGAMVTAMA